MKVAILALVFTSIAACGGMHTTPPAQIRMSSQTAVERCTQVGVIEERIESPTEDPGLEARILASVRERASKLGASDVVFTKKEVDSNYASASAEAYRCKR